MLEIKLNSVKIRSLVLMAIEDAIEYLSMDYPGFSNRIRIETAIREREIAMESQALRIKTICAPWRRDQIAKLIQSWNSLIPMTSQNINSWLQNWKELGELLDQINGRLAPRSNGKGPALWFQASNIRNHIVLSIDTPDHPRCRFDAAAWADCVTEMLDDYREHEVDQIDPADRLAMLYAYSIVEGGTVPSRKILPIRRDVLRECSTYLALADPGKGHLQTTVYSKQMLSGTIVHIETIDRQGNEDRLAVEPYRIPSIRDVARIRVHIGDRAPCSVFVGRPVFEGWNPGGDNSPLFRQSLLKAAHTVGAACSSMFYLGVAECKIGMDRLTTRQAIEVMKAIAGNVIRDKSLQMLSAAFNINTKIIDDRVEHNMMPVEVRSPDAIAQIAIELTSLGGFDKVTLDGASDGVSVPFLNQMNPAKLMDFVRQARERGLETYISAGMDSSNIGDAVRIGVGGVGMGIRLHERNAGGEITHLNEQVLEVLRKRDEADTTIAGRSAGLLAKMDWLRSHDALTQDQELKRDHLFLQIKYFLQSCQGTREARETAERNLSQRLEECLPIVEDGIRRLEQGETRGVKGCLSDPIIALADAQVMANTVNGRTTDSEFMALLESRDLESLKWLMGYQ